jgi:DNA-binding HxlR family transcriptional regulator
MSCSIAQCLEVVGDWWSLLIVRDAFRGITRFADLEADLGISRNVLNQRLAYLVDQGILERVAYSDHPPRYDYQLTEKGRDLFAVLTAMRQWGDRWAAPNGPPIEVVHDRCGEVSEGVLTCSVCAEQLTPDSVHPVPGPGGRPHRQRAQRAARAPANAERSPQRVGRRTSATGDGGRLALPTHIRGSLGPTSRLQRRAGVPSARG